MIRIVSERIFGAALLAAASFAVPAAVTPAMAEPYPTCGGNIITDCQAPAGSLAESSATESTQAYAGLRWNFGDNTPSLSLGVRHTRTDTDNSVVGAKLDFTFDFLSDAPLAPTIRLMGLMGNRDVQGEVGLGVTTSDWQGLIAAGIDTAYVNAGINFGFGGKLAPYIEVSSLGRPAAPKVSDGVLTCGSTYTLTPVSAGTAQTQWSGTLIVDDADVVGGFTCLRETPI